MVSLLFVAVAALAALKLAPGQDVAVVTRVALAQLRPAGGGQSRI